MTATLDFDDEGTARPHVGLLKKILTIVLVFNITFTAVFFLNRWYGYYGLSRVVIHNSETYLIAIYLLLLLILLTLSFKFVTVRAPLLLFAFSYFILILSFSILELFFFIFPNLVPEVLKKFNPAFYKTNTGVLVGEFFLHS